jgi:hypothetical protein
VYRKILHLAGSAKVFCRSAQLHTTTLPRNIRCKKKNGKQRQNEGIKKVRHIIKERKLGE